MTVSVAPFRLSLPMVRMFLADLDVSPGHLLHATDLSAGLLGRTGVVWSARQWFALLDAFDQLTEYRDPGQRDG